MAIDKFLLDQSSAALLIIDIQERLAVVMKQKDQVVKNVLHLVELAKMQNIPIVVTEQYPKGLGRTLPEITAVLPAHILVEKVSFNCCGEPSFNEQVRRLGKKKLIVTGMETHICVLQTSIGLLAEGYHVHLVSDAVCNPPETRLLAAARERGLPVLDGLSMLVYQGVIGFQLWTGLEPPVEVMKDALREALGIRR